MVSDTACGSEDTAVADRSDPLRPGLIGRSGAILAVAAAIDRVAASTASVLITGETGTGKDLVARLIHARSPRARGPFVVINCPALPSSLLEAELFGVDKGVATGVDGRPGRLESAAGGTVLLDEIGDLSGPAQAAVLRFLDDRTVEHLGGRRPLHVDARVLAATHHELAVDIASGAFRRDLYHRLNTVNIALPPLRQRREDIPLLLAHFLGRCGRPRLECSAEVLDRLLGYDYPGNVRELQRIVENMALLAPGPVVTLADLPEPLRRGAPDAESTCGHVVAEAGALLRRIVEGRESFWQVAQRPFLERRVSRAVLEFLVEQAYRKAGGSYRLMARWLGVEAELRRLLNFLYHHDLQVKKGRPDE